MQRFDRYGAPCYAPHTKILTVPDDVTENAAGLLEMMYVVPCNAEAAVNGVKVWP